MIGIRFNNVIQNVVLYYNDVEISVVVKGVNTPTDDVVKMDVDTIKLFHKNAGDITDLYIHDKYGNSEIYIEDGDEFTDELRSIFIFIDKLNEFAYTTHRAQHEEDQTQKDQ